MTTTRDVKKFHKFAKFQISPKNQIFIPKKILISQILWVLGAAYEFTTLTCVPGMVYYNDAKIQLLDLPGIIEGAAQGRGRGRQVIATAKSADLIFIVLDATKDDTQKEKLEAELESVGIRLNKSPPNISLTVKKGGGIHFNSTVKCNQVDEKMVYNILKEYKNPQRRRGV